MNRAVQRSYRGRRSNISPSGPTSCTSVRNHSHRRGNALIGPEAVLPGSRRASGMCRGPEKIHGRNHTGMYCDCPECTGSWRCPRRCHQTMVGSDAGGENVRCGSPTPTYPDPPDDSGGARPSGSSPRPLPVSCIRCPEGRLRTMHRRTSAEHLQGALLPVVLLSHAGFRMVRLICVKNS